ncbi:MAG: hypothetical protein PVJ92_00360 [Candidatus Dependentiae bacterium]|jgi:hypothetical protein
MKKTPILLLLGAALMMQPLRADWDNEYEMLRENPAGWIDGRLIDYRDDEGQCCIIAPEAEALSDLMAFHASHSSSPKAIRAAHLLRSAIKAAAILGSARKSIKSFREVSDIEDRDWRVSVGTAANTLSMGGNSLHRLFHDLPDSMRITKHASSLAARNAKQSDFADKNYKRERVWQWLLFAAQYLAAAAERNQMNMDDRTSEVLAWQSGTGTLRNLLRLWQQSRLSHYYTQNLAYALDPKKEKAAIQPQLTTKKRRHQRLKSIVNIPQNLWQKLLVLVKRDTDPQEGDNAGEQQKKD